MHTNYYNNDESALQAKKGMESKWMETSHQHTRLDFVWMMINGLSFVIGGICFLFGSIMYYPSCEKYNGLVIGGWMFLSGCICFVVGTLQDVLDTSASDTQITALFWGSRLNAIIYLFGSTIFCYGAVYFLPKYYENEPNIGAIAFIVGCIFFCVGAAWDMDCAGSKVSSKSFMENARAESNLFFLAFTTLIGAVLFIIGSIFFLPQYLEAGEDAVSFSVHWFVSGSIVFIVSAFFNFNLRWKIFHTPVEASNVA